MLKRLLIFASIAVLVPGCTRTINRAAERRIRDALPDLLGSARVYRAHVDSAPGATIGGHLSRVQIDGEDVQMSNGLLLDQIHIDLDRVDIDTAHKRIRSIGAARFTVTVTQTSVDEFLAGEAPEGEAVRNVRVVFSPGDQVAISAERVVLGVGVPFHLGGPVRVADPLHIEIDPNRLTVAGIPISGALLRFVKHRFDSGFDLSTLPIPVAVSQVHTDHGKMIITGAADVEAILTRAGDSID